MAKSKTLKIIAMTALMIALAAIGQLLIDLRTFVLEQENFLFISDVVANLILRIVIIFLLAILIFLSYRAIKMITRVENEK